MLLTCDRIHEAIRRGRILIEPFVETNLGPNSYDLTLSPHLLTYRMNPLLGPDGLREQVLDMRRENRTISHEIPPEGMILCPGILYLGATRERIASNHYVPCIEGRSSVGRLGISVHATAGVGDLGFDGTFTLEITVVHPVRVYAGVRIGQVLFFDCGLGVEPPSKLYRGKYRGQGLPKASEMWRDWQ